MSRTPVIITTDLADALSRHLTDQQLLELTHDVALEDLRGRFNLALEIAAAGSSQRDVSAVPDAPRAPGSS